MNAGYSPIDSSDSKAKSPGFKRSSERASPEIVEDVGQKSEDIIHHSTPQSYSTLECVSAAVLYALTGIGVTFINKFTLSFFKFPSPAFLTFCQLLVTVLVISQLKLFGYVTYADVSISSCWKVMPMPLFFLGNSVCSLGGTKMVTIPTFTALRKFSILFTMILEKVLLQRTSSAGIHFSVFLMMCGAFIAASQDLNFNALGYVYVMSNNVFTAGHYIVTSQKAELSSYGTFGCLYYCALISLPISLLLSIAELRNVIDFDHWSSGSFLISFVMSTIMGFLVTFATILCTRVNSGLTTSVIGCLRNVFPVYIGMMQVFDYTFNGINFIGHTVSVAGALLYSALKFIA